MSADDNSAGPKPATFVEALIADPSHPAPLRCFSGYPGRSSAEAHVRIYSTLALDEYLEVPLQHVRFHRSGASEELTLWVDANTRVTLAWSELRIAAGNIDGGTPPVDAVWRTEILPAFAVPPEAPRRKRPKWRGWIREFFPVEPGEHRRHVVSYRYVRNVARWLDEEDLKALGYDPAALGGLEAARWAWILDRFNDPANFWRGDGWENSWLGRMMRWHEPYNWDFPSDEEALREAERRAREAEEREEREAEQRESKERERLAREQREREERERLERERVERERREREERERLDRERLEREQREREERERLERERIERERREREEREHRERERRERERREQERRERERRERERERFRP